MSQYTPGFCRQTPFRRTIAISLVCSLLLASCESSSRHGPSAEESAAAVIRALEAIQDPAQREISTVFVLNTLCTLSRLAAGESDGRVENAIAPHFASLQPGVRTKIRTLGNTLRAIPASKRAQLLGGLAAHDPGPCTSAPPWDAIKHSVIFSHRQIPRLRGNFCTGNFSYADSTPADRVITAASHALVAIEGPPTVLPVASPVILGVEGVSARHPALQATGGTPIGNGISPFGVETDIPCSLTNDSCDAAQGLVCGTKISAGAHCIAFPVVQKDQDLILRGYNFWDIESARLVLTPLIAGQGTESVTVVGQVDANEPVNGAAACPAASATNPTHNRAHFRIAANEGHFYRLRVYNHNGNFVTQRDALDDAPPRVVHVCYPSSLGNISLPPGTIRDCTLPMETCPQDGAACDATWATPPRKLEDCRHFAGQPVVCGETPEWFVNAPLTEREDPVLPVTTDPVVFVLGDEPVYEFRTTLQAVECDEETGWDWPGSDEPMLLVAGFSSDPPPGTDASLLSNLDDNGDVWHGGDYDSGDRKLEVARLSTVRGLRFDSEVVYLVALLEDDGFLGAFLAGAAVLAAVAAIAILTGGGGFLAALGGAAGVVGLWAIIVESAFAGEDLLGRVTLVATPIAMDERIGASHTPDFLSAGTTVRALPQREGTPAPGHRANPRLIHPFVDFPLYEPLPAECNPGGCPSGESCLINRCVESGFVDPTTGQGFRERREFIGGGGHYAMDLLWEKVRVQ